MKGSIRQRNRKRGYVRYAVSYARFKQHRSCLADTRIRDNFSRAVAPPLAKISISRTVPRKPHRSQVQRPKRCSYDIVLEARREAPTNLCMHAGLADRSWATIYLVPVAMGYLSRNGWTKKAHAQIHAKV